MKSKRILIITIIIILVLAIAGTVFAYLFMATDTFKSDKELFSKYIYQNVETFQKFKNSQIIQKYSELNKEEKYESDTKIKTIYSEGGEVSSQFNNLSAVVTVQKNNSDNYFYADGQIQLGDQKYLESEIIKDQGVYGIRFTDVVKQFITIKNDNKLDDIANEIGIDSKILEEIMDTIDGTVKDNQQVISQDDIQKINEKYSKLITDAISNGSFTGNKKAQITYNNSTIMTKSYTVSLTNQQVEDLLLQILNNLKNEEIILNNLNNYKETYQNAIDKEISTLTEEEEVPGLKLTVYEQNKKTIRTVIEITGLDKIVIENAETETGVTSKIQVSEINAEETKNYNIELTKEGNDNNETMNLKIGIVNGENEYTISFLNDMENTEKNIKLKSTLEYQNGITNAAIEIENEVLKGEEFEKKQVLSDNNNFVLNNAEEETRKKVIDQLKERVPDKFDTRISLLSEALGISKQEDNDTIVPEAEMTQIDINKFNAKFEFYTGDEVSAENVKSLLEVVKGNLGNYEITTVNNPEDATTDPSKINYSIKLKIERNKVNEDGINEVLGKIDDKKKYKVTIAYKEQNKLIDYITIDEVIQ